MTSVWSAVSAFFADLIGKVLADVLKDWFSRPDAVAVSPGRAPLTDAQLSNHSDAARILSEWKRVSGHQK